jgi:hypothetical protein
MKVTEQAYRDEPRNHTGIIVAIFIAAVVISGTVFGVSTLFEKPRAFVTATYDPEVQELVFKSGSCQVIMQQYLAQEAENQVQVRALIEKLTGQKIPLSCYTYGWSTNTTTGGCCAGDK